MRYAARRGRLQRGGAPTARRNRRRRGGLLGGEPSLVAIVREILAGSLPKRVRVAEPNLDYVFTDSRDTLADMAAAMLVAGNGRGRLSDAGWMPWTPPWLTTRAPTPAAPSSTDP